jgi:hypothetical protein
MYVQLRHFNKHLSGLSTVVLCEQNRAAANRVDGPATVR